MEIIRRHPRLDALLVERQDLLGRDFTAYYHHCCRVLNFFAALSPRDDPESLDKAAIAVAFHDLAIWTDHSLDYLEPSAALAREWLAANGLGRWCAEIEAMILDHHKVTASDGGVLAEAFRQADWVDVTQGLRRFGLPLTLVWKVLQAFPNAGFHARLAQLSVKQLREHPTRPLPMFRW